MEVQARQHSKCLLPKLWIRNGHNERPQNKSDFLCTPANERQEDENEKSTLRSSHAVPTIQRVAWPATNKAEDCVGLKVSLLKAVKSPSFGWWASHTATSRCQQNSSSGICVARASEEDFPCGDDVALSRFH